MTSRVFLLFIILLMASACSVQPPDCADPQVFCVGLVTTTEGLNDHAFNQAAWEAMQITHSEGILQAAEYIESVDSKDYAKNIDAFALDGYDLVITTGMGLRDETLQAADLYPEMVFIGIDQAGEETRPNLMVITFPEDQAGFLAGALAAHLSQSAHIGAVCETSDFDSNWKTCEGFRNGAAYVDPQVLVDVRYRDNGSSDKLFIDTAWGQNMGRKLIHSGADILFGVGGGTGQGALLAAVEEGVYAIGSERDQFHALPEARPVLITSVFKQPASQILELIRAASGGMARGGFYTGQVQLAPYRDLDVILPPDVVEELEKLRQGLGDGSIRTNVPAAMPK